MDMMLESMFSKFGQTYEPNQIIFCENEPGNNFYLIQSGKVKIVKTVPNPTKKEDYLIKTLDILEQGDIFGEMAILEEQPRSATAIAISEVKVLNFNRANFELLMTKNPMLALKILTIFSVRINDAKRRLLILLMDDIQGKVADVFLMLYEKMHAHSDFKEIVLNVSQHDVAEWCAQPVGEVQKVLNTLSKSGKIELYEDKIVIHNIADFQRIVSQKRKPNS
ncbi:MULTISPECIES: Crp/Fnr family transcriptional regulator [Leptospira]|uniref:Cyclic nucleotide-binding domain protein n=3 Tax=Leptospira TaxID=171 RepID=M6CRX2_9LEPT|nr:MULTISPECIES: Crp/Fnr family transcriptional regulator [Leptospira]EMJ94439.1 cyclic nucleotide-binding domain protein [Leptospira alstonii serovar Sichuan str. 79601]EQA82591.1 cyclic nucleotide-binding domain protein [Leptospira alstonii serovar Pingchang str. 80-412]TGM09534.1 Crp/Fnr family transcriptional regulator [Leptospira barantonii]